MNKYGIRNFTTFCNFATEVTRNQGTLIGRVGSFSELLKFTVLSDVLASATSICDKVDKSVRFLVTLLKKRR